MSHPRARLLILGSMPGTASLDADEYYAHPRNAFWSIIDAVFGIACELPYATRCERLTQAGVAVWDVLERCHRPGSLDASIDPGSVVVNDFEGFFATHPEIARVCFNGTAAEKLFRRHALSMLPPNLSESALVRLPSTSPAHAAMSVAQKTARWRTELAR